MKTKISAGIIALLFLMACGSSDSNQTTFSQEPSKTEVKNEKFIIKASNSMYLSMSPDSLLFANQPDPTKAEIFEKVDLGNGKMGLKTAKGKFVSDNRSNESKIDVIRDQASGWEEFEIIALDQSSVNIRSSQGKYLCADQSKNNILIADREKPGAWETFVFEQK
jgi:hypothetical protein